MLKVPTRTAQDNMKPTMLTVNVMKRSPAKTKRRQYGRFYFFVVPPFPSLSATVFPPAKGSLWDEECRYEECRCGGGHARTRCAILGAVDLRDFCALPAAIVARTLSPHFSHSTPKGLVAR